MKKLELELPDATHAAMDGWRVIEAHVCGQHGIAMMVLFRPAEFAAVQAEVATQERLALMHCVIERYGAMMSSLFGVTVLPLPVMQIAIPVPPPAPPPAKPPADPKKN